MAKSVRELRPKSSQRSSGEALGIMNSYSHSTRDKEKKRTVLVSSIADVGTFGRNGASIDADEDSQKMPPPPTLPAHRLRHTTPNLTSEAHGTSSGNTFLDPGRGRDANLNRDPAGSIRRFSSRLLATSASATQAKSTSLKVQSVPSGIRPPTAPSLTEASEIQFPSSSRANAKGEVATADTGTDVSASASQTMSLTSSQTQMTARPGPPVLGMRRATSSSQAPSFSSSQRPRTALPAKQRRFRTPFAKITGAQHELPLTPNPTVNSAPASQDVNEKAKWCARTSTSIAPAIDRRIDETSTGEPSSIDVATTRRGSALASERRSTAAVICDEASNRSSSPAAEADESFGSADFDMGIDAEELERACSAYD